MVSDITTIEPFGYLGGKPFWLSPAKCKAINLAVSIALGVRWGVWNMYKNDCHLLPFARLQPQSSAFRLCRYRNCSLGGIHTICTHVVGRLDSSSM